VGAITVASLNLGHNDLKAEGAKSLAEALTVNTALTSLDAGWNSITGEGAEQLAKAVLEHTTLKDFCSIPLTNLRSDSVTELDLTNNGFGVPGAIVLAALLPEATALTFLNLANNDLGSANEWAKARVRQAARPGLDLRTPTF